MKKGTLSIWFNNRAYGIVAVSFNERYFLRASRVTEIPNGVEFPEAGSTVYFDVIEPQIGGKLRKAINARMIPPQPPKLITTKNEEGGR